MKGSRSKSTINWGFIGCGDVTELKSGPAYQQQPGFEVVAVMSRSKARVKDYAQRHGIPKYYTNAETLIDDPEINAVYIATPPDSHLHYARLVANAEKICCIEKPLAPSFAEAQQICDAFSTKNIPLFVAYYRRSLPRFEAVNRWLKANRIGQIRHVSWNLHKPANQRDLDNSLNWRTDAKIARAGYFDDLASHGLNLFSHWLGEIVDATGITCNQQGLYTAADAVSGCWIHETGVTGSGVWNFGSYERRDQVSIIGSNGQITLSIFDDSPITLTTEKSSESLAIKHPASIQQYHVENMYKHLNGQSTHPSMGASAAKTNWVMDHMTKSYTQK